MKNKKKYDIGSIELVERTKIFGKTQDIHATESESVDAPEFYPINGEMNFSDTQQFNRIAMAGPFTSP